MNEREQFEKMPSPSVQDIVDPLFNAIWNATKTWDVNAPEYYEGYCGLNGSHVMVILNSIRASQPAQEPVLKPLRNEHGSLIFDREGNIIYKTAPPSEAARIAELETKLAVATETLKKLDKNGNYETHRMANKALQAIADKE